MPVRRTQVIALAVTSIASVALAIGGIALLAGAMSAEASTGAPEASISSGSSADVPALPGEPEPREAEPSAAPLGEAALSEAEPSGDETQDGEPDEPALDPAAVLTDAEALPLGPIDSAAIAAGFREGAYRFSARTVGFASFAAATPLEVGDVRDPEHYALAWPDSAFISRYERDGDDRTAWIGESVLDLVPGDGWERTPDEMLPLDFYVAAIEPWVSALPAGSADGTYAAKTAVLTSQAQAIGVSAAGWALTVTVDGRGRLVSATFEGLVRGRPFEMAIEVTYDDTAGASIPAHVAAEPAAGPADPGH